MKALGSVASVIAAIREDGGAAVDVIEREGDAAVARINAEAERASLARQAPELSSAVAAARERARISLAQEDWEDARTAIAEREEWIARAVELGRAALDQPESNDDRRQTLAALAREAMTRLPAGSLEIVVSATDAELLDAEWCAALTSATRAGSAHVVAGPIAGGCVVRSSDGRALFDNTRDARADRLESEWRSALADIYERATAAIRRDATEAT